MPSSAAGDVAPIASRHEESPPLSPLQFTCTLRSHCAAGTPASAATTHAGKIKPNCACTHTVKLPGKTRKQRTGRAKKSYITPCQRLPTRVRRCKWAFTPCQSGAAIAKNKTEMSRDICQSSLWNPSFKKIYQETICAGSSGMQNKLHEYVHAVSGAGPSRFGGIRWRPGDHTVHI